MGGIFSRGPIQKALVDNIPRAESTAAAPAAKPDPVAAPAPAAGLGESRAPVTRAATMLSNRRAGEDPRVGTKKLLGQ